MTATTGRKSSKAWSKAKAQSWFPKTLWGRIRLGLCWTTILYLAVMISGVSVSFHVRPTEGGNGTGDATVEVIRYSHSNSSAPNLYTNDGLDKLPGELGGKQISYLTQTLPRWNHWLSILGFIFVLAVSVASMLLRRRWYQQWGARPNHDDPDESNDYAPFTPWKNRFLRWGPVWMATIFSLCFVMWLLYCWRNDSGKGEIMMGTKSYLAMGPLFLTGLWGAAVYKSYQGLARDHPDLEFAGGEA